MLEEQWFYRDYLNAPSPKTTYMICSPPRSGSTLLCRTLERTNLAGLPHEYFNDSTIIPFFKYYNVTNIYDYIDELVRRKTSPNGVFGFKVQYLYQYDRYLKDIDLLSIFPKLKFIYTTRRDHIKQAISLSKALQSGQFESYLSKQKEPVFDYDHIQWCQHEIEKHEAGWETYFASRDLHPLRVVYEDLSADIDSAIKKIMQYLDIDIPPGFKTPDSSMRKLADDQTRQWHREYQILTTIEQVEEFLKDENYISARNILNQRIQTYPDSATLIVLLGKVTYRFGAVQRAIREFEKAISMQPTLADAHFNLAIAHAKLGDYPNALQEARNALSHKPGDPEITSLLTTLETKTSSSR